MPEETLVGEGASVGVVSGVQTVETNATAIITEMATDGMVETPKVVTTVSSPQATTSLSMYEASKKADSKSVSMVPESVKARSCAVFDSGLRAFLFSECLFFSF